MSIIESDRSFNGHIAYTLFKKNAQKEKSGKIY